MIEKSNQFFLEKSNSLTTEIIMTSMEHLTQTTDFLIGNGSNMLLSSELPSSTYGNRTSGGIDSVVPKVSFIIASVICIVGFLGNSATIVGFLVQKKVQTPTYTGIFCSSIADLTALLSRYRLMINSCLEFRHSRKCRLISMF